MSDNLTYSLRKLNLSWTEKKLLDPSTKIYVTSIYLISNIYNYEVQIALLELFGMKIANVFVVCFQKSGIPHTNLIFFFSFYSNNKFVIP